MFLVRARSLALYDFIFCFFCFCKNLLKLIVRKILFEIKYDQNENWKSMHFIPQPGFFWIGKSNIWRDLKGTKREVHFFIGFIIPLALLAILKTIKPSNLASLPCSWFRESWRSKTLISAEHTCCRCYEIRFVWLLEEFKLWILALYLRQETSHSR